jgi:AraC-like DNA-binding protein
MPNIPLELEVLSPRSESLRFLQHGWPDPLCRWHSHKECEIHLLVTSNGKAFVGDYIGDFGPGSLFLTGPHLPHNWITDAAYSDPVELRDLVIQFDQERIMTMIKAFPEFTSLVSMLERAQSGIEFTGIDAAKVQSMMEAARDASGTVQIMGFLELLLYMSRHTEKRALSVRKLYHKERSSKQLRITEVVDHVVENYTDDLSVQKAADMAGMSAATFSRNFQTVTGNRFVEFVNRVRIGQACGMLYATEDHVTTICYQVGFQNLANFNRHFLKIKGMTPSSYREMARRELAQAKETAI